MTFRRVPSYACLILLVLTAGLAACGSSLPPVASYDGKCIGMADDLKTLRTGDELPRVIQVIGWPTRSYRAYSPFGHSYDVLEYDIGGSPCTRAVLHIDKKLQVIFDNKGGYVGSGDESFMRFRRATTVRVEPLVIDPVILKP